MNNAEQATLPIQSDSDLRESPYVGLPFVGGTVEALKLWQPERSGNCTADNETGRRYARQLLSTIAERSSPTMLGHVCRAIGEAGSFGGVEIGFFHYIAEASAA